MIPEAVVQKFWARVDASAGAEDCWPWLGAFSAYGTLLRKGRIYPAHRLSWEILASMRK